MSNDHEAETRGARRALSCVGHELASPLMALLTHVERAIAGRDGAADQLRACVKRLAAISEATREVAQTLGQNERPARSVDMIMMIESAAARVPAVIAIESAGPATAVGSLAGASYLVTAAVRAVVRTAPDGAGLRASVERDAATVRVRIDAGAPPATWGAIEPWSSERSGLDLWTAAVVAGEEGGRVRVGEVDGAIAVEVELPAEAPR